jgi:hypothetical protein
MWSWMASFCTVLSQSLDSLKDVEIVLARYWFLGKQLMVHYLALCIGMPPVTVRKERFVVGKGIGRALFIRWYIGRCGTSGKQSRLIVAEENMFGGCRH